MNEGVVDTEKVSKVVAKAKEGTRPKRIIIRTPRRGGSLLEQQDSLLSKITAGGDSIVLRPASKIPLWLKLQGFYLRVKAAVLSLFYRLFGRFMTPELDDPFYDQLNGNRLDGLKKSERKKLQNLACSLGEDWDGEGDYPEEVQTGLNDEPKALRGFGKPC